jgi:hypothetical protein
MPAHRDLRSTAQNRDSVWGVALMAAVEPDSSSVAPSANIRDLFVMLPSLPVGFSGLTTDLIMKKCL